MATLGTDLSELLDDRDGVVSTSEVLGFITERQLRWRVSTGRWQKPARGVVVAQSGPLTERQLLRAALLRAGPQAVLAGLTAARWDGLAGFGDRTSLADRPVYLLAPYGYKRRTPPLKLTVITHYSQALTELDVHPETQALDRRHVGRLQDRGGDRRRPARRGPAAALG